MINTNAKAVQIGNNTSNPGITIDSGTGTIAVGTGAQARTINFGTGGAVQDGAIELQGDLRDRVRARLATKGFVVKG